MTTAVGRYDAFRFVSYGYDRTSATAVFEYAFDDAVHFKEVINFEQMNSSYDESALDGALFYTFIALGTSYYKLFPGAGFVLESGSLTEAQADFFHELYTGGLSQFLYENSLSPDVIPAFPVDTAANSQPSRLDGEGSILLQSGGKDSLLTAALMREGGHDFDAWHMSSTGHHPAVIESISAQKVIDVTRQLDLVNIKTAQAAGGLNGHVPFSAIVAGVALIDAVMRGRRYIIAAMEASSDEGNTMIGDFAVNHMYSKTYAYEVQLQDYIHTNIALDIDYVSLIRPFTDLRVAEMFVDRCWISHKNSFASCNVANYKQGKDDGTLSWCGNCSKCANSFLLFAPFVPYDELTSIFNGENLFTNPALVADFRALLGMGGIKPFECVGTVDELRQAYYMAYENDTRFRIEDLAVAGANGDYRLIHDHQSIVGHFLASELLESRDN